MKLATVRNSMGIHLSKWENLAIDQIMDLNLEKKSLS